MIVNTGMWAKYIAMAAPLRAEYRPMSFAVNPRESGPTSVAASQSLFSNTVPVKGMILPSDS